SGTSGGGATTPPPETPMRLTPFPFCATDWNALPATRFPGDRGWADVRIQSFADLCIRRIDFSPGYVSDHWSGKGHVAICLDGQLETDLCDRSIVLRPGMTCQLGERSGRHRSHTADGARVLVIE